MLPYRLTDEEFRYALDALAYAEEHAISDPERFGSVASELIRQHDHHDEGKDYTSDRFDDEADDDPDPATPDPDDPVAIEPVDVDAHDSDEALVYALVEANGELPQKVIHEHVPVSRSKVSVVLKRLEAKGAVEREVVAAHGAKVVRDTLLTGKSGTSDENAETGDPAEADVDTNDGASDTDAADEPSTPDDEDDLLDPDDPEDLRRAYAEADSIAEVARQFPMGKPAIMQRLAAKGLIEGDGRESNGDVGSLDLSEYGQSGQVITPEMVVEALDGAQAVYQVKRELRLADREVEDICRKLGLLDRLRGGGPKLPRADVEAAVREAVA